MSSVVINGDTSGAVTLSAPATAGTVTVTLPATSGTMLTTASSTGVSGSAISSGTVAEAYGGTGTNTGYYGFKNRIINGAMVISQRGTSFTPADGDYTLDRYLVKVSQSSKLTVAQSTTAPSGFSNSYKVTSSAATTVGTSDYFAVGQYIEGFNVADLNWGSANAKTVTLSFQVYSSLTGTFGGVLQNYTRDRGYPFTYTISSANTWTSISVTIAGDTSGTWVNDSGLGIRILWGLGVGSTYTATATGAWQATGVLFSASGCVNVVSTNAATWYVTGVQLEKGSTATSFDYRPYGTELQLCQRYYYKIQASQSGNRIVVTNGLVNSSTACIYCTGGFPATMRTSPTSTQSGLNINDGSVTNSITSISNTTSMPNGFSLSFTTGTSTLTSGRTGFIIGSGNSSDYIDFSAEL